ncbi:hypothetical protein AGMMS50268_40910 [Spirochaetia bacterium]|nr:hypothetical protein AGMMS50268_40910 [Spirochaetia bacterium]
MCHVKTNHGETNAPRKNLTIRTHYIRHKPEEWNGVYYGGKKKITAEYAPRYRTAKKSEKTRLLDEYLRLTGSKSRKYAIFKLNRVGKVQLRTIGGETVKVKIVEKNRKKRVYTPYYDAEVATMLLFLWQRFNWQCGKLFAPFMRQNLDIIRQVKPYLMSDLVAAKLKKISPRTIDRLLKKPQ